VGIWFDSRHRRDFVEEHLLAACPAGNSYLLRWRGCACKRSSVNRAIAAGASSGIAKTELTLISHST
jgi:hypothetical protein